jgi:calcium/calmodulin-dependent protein kinase I
MKGVLNGLSELSKKNVIHRDLKPDNIMFRTTEINSDVVIIDFGLATVAN